MSRFIKKTSKVAGLPPGSIIHIGDKTSGPVKINVIDYEEKNFQEKELKSVDECSSFKNTPTVTWINIDGIHQIDIIEKIGKCYDLHPLILEDIVNTGQRPKLEDFEQFLFVVLKMLYMDEKKHEIQAEQVSLIIGSNFVISFQEKEGDVFNSIRERIRNSKGKIRKMGADYLAYTLLDAIIDNYSIILEKIGGKVEEIEEELVSNPIPDTVHEIHNLKREMIFLRKSVWPLREVISGIQRGESSIFKKTTAVYLRDLYDHTIQVIDTIETFRDMVSGMLDIYMSSVSNKMNEVMKVLTIFAAIFIPLTFIAGVYGMNFQNMPELSWQWGYFSVLIVMLIVGISLRVFFKRKKWL